MNPSVVVCVLYSANKPYLLVRFFYYSNAEPYLRWVLFINAIVNPICDGICILSFSPRYQYVHSASEPYLCDAYFITAPVNPTCRDACFIAASVNSIYGDAFITASVVVLIRV